MKVHTFPDTDSLAAIVVEPGEHVILKKRGRLSAAEASQIRQAVEQTMPDVPILLVDEVFDVAVLADPGLVARPPELEFENPELLDQVTETRDAQAGAMELRCLELTEIRVEGGEDGKPLKFVGKAAPYESLSKPMKVKTAGGKEVRFREKIAKGAFDDVLKGKGAGGEALMLVGHDPHKALARRSVGTLKFEDKPDGLYFEAVPANTTLARDTAEDVKAGNIRGMSIGFGDPEDRWEKINGENVRTLTRVPLKEVSATTIPAYEDTTIESRSAEMAIAELDAGVTEVRGNVPGASMVSMHCRSAMYACREAHDAMERAIETLGSADGNLNEHEKRHVRDLKKHVQSVTAKAGELREAISSITDIDAGAANGDGAIEGNANGTPPGTAAKNPPGGRGARGMIAGDGSDTPLDAGADPLRSLAWRQRVQQAAEMDIPTKELRSVPFGKTAAPPAAGEAKTEDTKEPKDPKATEKDGKKPA